MRLPHLQGRPLFAVCVVLLAACASLPGVWAEPPLPADGDTGAAKDRTNRLARETSPYLLLHAHNPVDWYAWGPEALEKARRDDKPIFLSIGYSSCYWCHVMERLVFSNAEIAAYMNEHFVNVKVDREERPDLDDIYMTAQQVYFRLIGSEQSGGWPLSMFLTPAGRPFAGGSYFPPKDTDGRMGFPTVAKVVVEHWTTKRDQVEQNAERITDNVRRVMTPPLMLTPTLLEARLIAEVGDALLAGYDSRHGGLDFRPEQPDGPKFPVPAKLALLQFEARRADNADAARAVDHTLARMAAGGIRDHLGGGFHRYSTDREWLVPHFEKMLYDQAQLAVVYADAYERTNSQLYRETAEEILGFVLREMTDARGGFRSALDAETDGVEGAYYVWSRAEIERVLGKDDAAIFAAAYGLDRPQLFEQGYVLHCPAPPGETAGQLGLSPTVLRQRLNEMRGALLAERSRRTPLRRDDKILTGWNGLMIHALARAGDVFERAEYTRAAERGALFVLGEMRDSQGRLHRSYCNGEASLNAYLDDYAFLVQGLLSLHEATGNEKWLYAAQRLTDDQIAQFWDVRSKGFFFTAEHHEELLVRTRNAYDGVLPSGNGVSVRNLVRLASLTGEEKYRDYAQQTLMAFAPALRQSPRGTATLALALGEFLQETPGLAEGDKNFAAPADDDRLAVAMQSSSEEPAEHATAPIRQTAGEAPQKKPKNERISARAFLSVDRLPAAGTCEIVVLIDVEKGWHINTNPAQPKTLVPTKLSLKTKRGTELAKVFYPAGKKITVPGLKEPQLIYEDRVALRGILQIPRSAAGGQEEIEIIVRYQACNESTCLPPKTVTLNGKLAVAAPGEAVKEINQNLFPPLDER